MFGNGYVADSECDGDGDGLRGRLAARSSVLRRYRFTRACGNSGHSDSGATAVALQGATVRCASRRGNAAIQGAGSRRRDSNPRRSFWRAFLRGGRTGSAQRPGSRSRASMSNPAGSWWQGAAPRPRGEIRLHAGDVAGEGPCGVEDPWCGRARRPFLLAARDAPLPERWLGVESFDRPGIASRSLRPHLTRNGAGEASCH
jgi:hypothetical protein